VVVPAYNAAETLPGLLEALAQQTLPPHEILIVDDGSSDGSAELAEEWAVSHPGMALKVIRQHKQGPATARNQGSASSTGELVVFIDSDCLPEADWLEKMADPFSDPRVVGVQGAYRCNQKEWIARFSQLEIEERYSRMRRTQTIDFIGTYAAAYRRDVFNEQGCFDTRFTMASGEDADFSFRLASRGLRLVFEPSAVVYHRHPTTLGRYLRQKYWRAYWRNLIYRRHFAKMWKDSYTPHTLKLQTGLGLVFPVSLAGIPFGPPWNLAPLVVLAAVVLLSLPFTLWTFRKNVSVACGAPFVLFLRTFALAAGAAHGFVRGLWVRKDLR
jgi:cellulose synthase/poly-beta-1,6-N-acetylglucosamine synthase-like glycosyltransferase